MDYDLSESIPQGFDGTQEAENRRIEGIAHQLQRLCGIYEAECEAGGKHVNKSGFASTQCDHRRRGRFVCG